MKIIGSILLAFLVSGNAWANGASGSGPVTNPNMPASETVQMSADLYISKCQGTNDDMYFCGVIAAPAMVRDVVLKPVMTPIGYEADHLRGSFVTVEELDGLRYLGIVTIDAYGVSSGGTANPVSRQYYLTVEIMDNNGVMAKMSVNASSMDDLAWATLYGEKRVVGSNRYTPHFYVGPKPANVCDPSGKCPNNTGSAKWSVLQGAIAPL